MSLIPFALVLVLYAEGTGEKLRDKVPFRNVLSRESDDCFWEEGFVEWRRQTLW